MLLEVRELRDKEITEGVEVFQVPLRGTAEEGQGLLDRQLLLAMDLLLEDLGQVQVYLIHQPHML
jgi:hypothetical protein